MLCVIFFSCNNDEQVGKKILPVSGRFTALDTNYHARVAVLAPSPLKFTVIFRADDDIILPDGGIGKAKGSHDFLALIPVPGDENAAWLWCNHETKGNNDVLEDGGGATLIQMKNGKDGWKAGGKYHVDFRPVGGTLLNCLGSSTPWQTVITSEEVEPTSNKRLVEFYGIRDTTPVAGHPRYMNYGWMVEVNVNEKRAMRKLYAMGRFMHEGALVMEDEKTVYLLDDYAPGMFFKFVADTAGILSSGTLHAYKQSPDGNSGEWIALPRDRESLNQARKTAMQLGATIFLRPEDIVRDTDGTFYISETGNDLINLSAAMAMGGVPAKHLGAVAKGEGYFDDPFGRILRFDPSSGTVSVFLEGGAAEQDPSIHLSNPDNMAIDTRNRYLLIQEDLIAYGKGRIPDSTRGETGSSNEVFFLPLGSDPPRKEQLQRFAIAPAGGETTGAIWTPDFNTLFFNIQAPSPSNPEPWNKSCTVMVTGFGK